MSSKRQAVSSFFWAVFYTILFILADGAVFEVLWNWFATRLGAHPISFALSIGLNALLTVVVSVMPSWWVNPNVDTDEAAVHSRFYHAYMLIVVLFVGFIAHLFL